MPSMNRIFYKIAAENDAESKNPVVKITQPAFPTICLILCLGKKHGSIKKTPGRSDGDMPGIIAEEI